VGGIAATVSGRAIVGGLLELLPGAGSIVGGVIASATAGTMTTLLGEAYLSALEKVFATHHGEQPSPSEVLAAIKETSSNRSK
jgi:uncharacterized protein (DUF697 family)